MTASRCTFLLGILIASSAWAQTDAVVLKTEDQAATDQDRLVVTTSTATEHAELRVTNSILRLSSTTAGTNAAAGDIRLNGALVEYHDGTSFRTLATTDGTAFVQNQFSSAQAASFRIDGRGLIENTTATTAFEVESGVTTGLGGGVRFSFDDLTTGNGILVSYSGSPTGIPGGSLLVVDGGLNRDAGGDGAALIEATGSVRGNTGFGDAVRAAILSSGLQQARAGSFVTTDQSVTGTSNYGVWGEVVDANVESGAEQSHGGFFRVNRTGTGGPSTSYGVYAEVAETALNSTAYGLYATASGATTNWAAFFDQGNVNVTGQLHVDTIVGRTSGTNAILIDGSNNVSRPAMDVAFYAYNQTDDNIGGTAVIDFDNSGDLNTGQYDGASDRFTAPADGVYHFSTAVLVNNLSVGATMTLSLRRYIAGNPTTILLQRKLSQATLDCVRGSVTIPLLATDQVEIRFTCTDTSTRVENGRTSTWFSGHRVY